VPVEQATRFDLVLNLQTARSQGLAFPPAVLLRADRIIDCSERERAAAEL
jgi:putative ABC transport system substrate-binding protein